jgi:hypothetical protein
VVHEALERVTCRIAESGPSSDSAAAAVTQTLRALGGITAFLKAVIEDLGKEFVANPRAVNERRDVREDLERRLPELRMRTHRLLGRVSAEVGRWGTPRSRDGQAGKRESEVVALGVGSYTEVPLRHALLNWFGRADYLCVDVDGCEIIDFKTGVAKEHHALQLQVYAWLWYHDNGRNPRKSLARALRLVYPGDEVAVPAPSPAELEQLGHVIEERTRAAVEAISAVPPDARPSREACPLCDVRQLCPAYWRVEVQQQLYGEEPREARDIEVKIINQQAEWSWRAQCVSHAYLPSGSAVLLRAQPRDVGFAHVIDGARQLRLQDVVLSEPSEESGGVSVISVGASSEAFVVR